MNTNLKSVTDTLKACEEKHNGELKGKSGKSSEWEAGFVAGLHYVREFLIPCFETTEIDEATAIEARMQEEIEDLKAKQRFGL